MIRICVIAFSLSSIINCLTLQNGYVTTQSDITSAESDIETLIKNNAANDALTDLPFIGGFVRVAFHDCVGEGGCDGCFNHSIADNAGLKKYTDELDTLYDASYSTKMSRADFYMLSSIVALDMASVDSTDPFPGRNLFKLGRVDCSTSPTEDVIGVFPEAKHGITETLAYFDTQFGFTENETVALLGAHTLGRARVEDSGFEGRWVRRPNNIGQMRPASHFDNEYYKTFIDRPMWFQHTVNASGNIQWQGIFNV